MRSFPWDSLIVEWGEDGLPVYDRAYSASDWHEVYRTFFSNGIFVNSYEPFVVREAGGMKVTVSPGKCCINGVIGWEDETMELTLEAPSANDRIDTIVLRWDSSISGRFIDMYVKKGTMGDTPVAPMLDRNDTYYELGIADIYIPKYVHEVAQFLITDTRLLSYRCGVVAPFMRLDTTEFFEQLQAATDRAIRISEDALSGSTAASLQLQVDDRVKKAGDTMTGNLSIPNSHVIVGDYENNRYTQVAVNRKGSNGNKRRGSLGCDYETAAPQYISLDKENNRINYLSLNDDNTSLGKPLNVASGGTGFTSRQALFDLFFPVGAVVIRFDSTSPASLYGGSWERIGGGYFLRAGDDTSTNGSDTRTLTVNQLPSHSHSLATDIMVWSNSSDGNTAPAAGKSMKAHGTAWTTGAVGGGGSFDNRPRYQNVFVWKRVPIIA